MTKSVLISPRELEGLLKTDDIVLIDTRDPKDYADGHIERAVNIREVFTFLATSTKEGLEELRATFCEAFGKAGLSGSETVVIYEESMDTGFGQSFRGYFLLRFLGYSKAKVLHGGYRAWVDDGMEVTQDVPAPSAQDFACKPDSSNVLIDLEEMKAALTDPSIIKLDVRDIDEWIGESSSPYGKDYAPRKGRLTGAVWIEWYRMMKPTPEGLRFKSKNEILAECATVGITPDTPVIVYCFKGARAANTFVALKEAGIKNVSVYFSSWNEWSRYPDLPIETGLPFGKTQIEPKQAA
ncbi:MAG: sulfurtransferase [Hyphomonadaceae bacterium]|nr:sulfurtransferase [Hyphomonadaceae bacterium]